MDEPKFNRKLAAILSADVVGYSRLMANDEAATVETLKQYRATVGEVTARHKGRIVNAPGDNILAEFLSAVEAVRAAVEVQSEIEDQNVKLPEDRRMRLRVGVNLGDVIEEDDGTIYGDGVNIAARMEALAPEGGICISGTMYDAVVGKLQYSFDFLGDHQVKNIDRPIKVYAVRSKQVATSRPKPRPTKWAIAAMTGLAVLAVAIAFFKRAEHTTSLDRDPATISEEQPLAVPTGPSIAVLPFRNLGGDEEMELLVDGLTQDIISGLTQFPSLFVIAADTTLQFKDNDLPATKIGQKLNARFVVTGSIRRSGDSVRIATELIDTRTGQAAWSKAFDNELTAMNIFVWQDEITAEIVSTLGDEGGAMAGAEIESLHGTRTESLNSYECVLKAFAYARILTRDRYEVATSCLRETVERDPYYADAWAWLALMSAEAYWTGYEERADPLQEAENYARQAIMLDPRNQVAHRALADAFFFRHELDEFFEQAKYTIALNPNNTSQVAALANRMAYAGQWEHGIAQVRRAMKLNPHYPGWYHFSISFNLLRQGDHEAALAETHKANLPGVFWYHALLAANYAYLGRREEAAAQVKKVREVYPDFGENAISEMRKWNFQEDLINEFVQGLRSAGLHVFNAPPVAH